MDLRFVESLVQVVDTGSLASAARVQGVTPAAVAQRVSALEASLGVPLLRRIGRKMHPTPELQSLLPELRKLLSVEAGLQDVLAQDQLTGSLRLGAVSSALGDYARGLVETLRAEAPAVRLELTPGASTEVFAAFKTRKLDAALIVRPPFDLAKTMVFTPVVTQPIGMLTPKQDHPDLPAILYSRQAWGGAVCYGAMETTERVIAPLCEMDAVETIAQMVSDGIGWSVLPSWRGLPTAYPNATFTPIEGATRQIGLLSWRQDFERPIQAVLRNALGVG